jgi:hypothetical protein
VTDLDPQITMVLDRLVPIPAQGGDWGRVLADAGATKPRNTALRSRRLALALVALAALAAAFAFVPALAGQGYFWFLDHPGAPKPTTPVVTVTSITDRSGVKWELTAYKSEDQGLCFQLTPELTGEGRGGGGACGSPLPIGTMMITSDAFNRMFILGPVTSDAQRVEIRGSAGQVEAKVAAAPEALRSDVKFYVAQLPATMADAPMTVKALDDQGDLIASFAVPTRSPKR